MRILLVGDVFGRPGREAFARITPKLRAAKNIDLVIANGENAAAGRGINRKAFELLQRGGADIITGGNHIWDNKEILSFIDDEPYIVRPANYPEPAPGRGWCVYPWRAKQIGVVNLCGRAFMPPVDCPFQKMADILREIRKKCDIIILDFHAETTAEKIALGWYLDGRIEIMVGTHTHVQTADERILPGGTAYLTDLGMVGPRDSVIGDSVDCILQKFTTGRPVRFAVAEGPCVYSGLIVDIDDKTNRPVKLERILLTEE